MKITTIGIDLAKQSYSVHGVDAHGKVMLRKTVSCPRRFKSAPPCRLNSDPGVVSTV
jgi:transposase